MIGVAPASPWVDGQRFEFPGAPRPRRLGSASAIVALHAQRPRRRLTALHKLLWIASKAFCSGWRKPLVLVNKQIHMIVDNYATHKHPRVERWLECHPRFRMHFTPTGCSWLNMVERFFRDLTENRLRRGVLRSVEELITAIFDYIDHHNDNPKPFIWTAKASDILEKVKRARAAQNNRQSA